MGEQQPAAEALPLPRSSIRRGAGPIVCGYDGGQRSGDGLELTRLLAATLEARVEVLCVLTSAPTEATWAEFGAMLETGEERFAAEVREALRGHSGVEVTMVPGPSPARELHDLAERCGASLITLGSTQRGPLGRVVPGTVADRLLAGAPCPVAVAPAGYASGHRSLRRIAVAFDASAEARVALASAIELARLLGGALELVTIANPHDAATTVPMVGGWGGTVTTQDSVAREERRLRRVLEETLSSIGDRVEASGGVVVDLDPAAVVAEASKRSDLLLIGSRGYGPIGRVLLGSVSSRVLRTAECPVIATPRPALTA